MARIAQSGPFLGERITPVLAVPHPRKRADVLHHPAFLVVSFLYKEAVVLNLRLLFSRPGSGLNAGQPRPATKYRNPQDTIRIVNGLATDISPLAGPDPARSRSGLASPYRPARVRT